MTELTGKTSLRKAYEGGITVSYKQLCDGGNALRFLGRGRLCVAGAAVDVSVRPSGSVVAYFDAKDAKNPSDGRPNCGSSVDEDGISQARGETVEVVTTEIDSLLRVLRPSDDPPEGTPSSSLYRIGDSLRQAAVEGTRVSMRVSGACVGSPRAESEKPVADRSWLRLSISLPGPPIMTPFADADSGVLAACRKWGTSVSVYSLSDERLQNPSQSLEPRLVSFLPFEKCVCGVRLLKPQLCEHSEGVADSMPLLVILLVERARGEYLAPKPETVQASLVIYRLEEGLFTADADALPAASSERLANSITPKLETGPGAAASPPAPRALTVEFTCPEAEHVAVTAAPDKPRAGSRSDARSEDRGGRSVVPPPAMSFTFPALPDSSEPRFTDEVRAPAMQFAFLPGSPSAVGNASGTAHPDGGIDLHSEKGPPEPSSPPASGATDINSRLVSQADQILKEMLSLARSGGNEKVAEALAACYQAVISKVVN